MPRVILVPGLGLFGIGRSANDAAIAADIAESWVETVTGAEAIGRFESLSETELFAMEYWSLEQAKRGRAEEKPLAGQVALVTGGAGTIGFATAAAMRAAGAETVLADLDRAAAEQAAARLDGPALGLACDVTDPASVRAAFDRATEHSGGVDIVVSNAGAALQGRIGEVEDAVLRKSFELNFFAHQTVAQNAVRIMLAQKTGGCLLFNVSRQAVSQGPNAGPYGLPKAATLFLMKQYALEYAGIGIRANAVNADGIRSGLMTPDFIGQRAAAYGMTEAEYMSRNLLKREVTAEDVAQAFLSLALARNTTGAFLPVDGGNLAARLPYCDALFCTRGILRSVIPAWAQRPMVLRASGGPSILKELSDEQIAMDMEDAVRLNAAGVGIQVFIGGEFETRSIHNMTRLVDAGLRVGMPVMGVTAVGRDMVRDAKYFRLACRIIAEMGAQYVKTYFVADGFETVTASCPVPIVMAGGQQSPEIDALTMAYTAVPQGAWRGDLGRHIFQSDAPKA